MARFGSFPTWWIRDQGPTLKAFRGGANSGSSIAALKILVALAVLCDFSSRKAKSSISDLEVLTGLSRPMVLKGIVVLEDLAIITTDRSGHINEYKLLKSSIEDTWAKVPSDLIRQKLKEILNRGVVPLTALKIYLVLVSIRPNQSTKVSLSHEKLRDFTGIQKHHVRSGLDILFSHGFIHIEKVMSEKNPHNVYHLRGI